MLLRHLGSIVFVKANWSESSRAFSAETRHLVPASVMLFGSRHLILIFVSSTNYFERVRRQCCLCLPFLFVLTFSSGNFNSRIYEKSKHEGLKDDRITSRDVFLVCLQMYSDVLCFSAVVQYHKDQSLYFPGYFPGYKIKHHQNWAVIYFRISRYTYLIPSAQRVGFFNIGSGRVSGGSGRSVEIYDLVFPGISFYSGVFPGSLGISGYVRYFRVYPYILRFLFNIYWGLKRLQQN